MNMNVLKNGVIASFRVTEIERRDWPTTVSHAGALIKVTATKFVAKLLHDQKESDDKGGDDGMGDYAIARDPAATLTMSFYTWGYKVGGKYFASSKKPDGNEFGATFLKPADWTRLLNTVGYTKESRSFPKPVYVKMKLSGTRNYLGEFGDVKLKEANIAVLNDMDEMLDNFESAAAGGADSDIPMGDEDGTEGEGAPLDTQATDKAKDKPKAPRKPRTKKGEGKDAPDKENTP